MRADYDSEANALELRLRSADHCDASDEIEEFRCHVGTLDGQPVRISLLSPAEDLNPLRVVAKRYDLDAEELLATAQAALAAPDHLVEVSVGKSLVA